MPIDYFLTEYEFHYLREWVRYLSGLRDKRPSGKTHGAIAISSMRKGQLKDMAESFLVKKGDC